MLDVLTFDPQSRTEIIPDIYSVSYSRNMRYSSLYMDTGNAFILTTYYA